ncbi:hypothetical protein DVH24_042353 [Malus domestica]|uniref:Uncharacterized protein n=2 Tax=Malus domestica TaxID=3750 RepID=A0A498J2Q6_MALDO|nr:hypothetical protein DVH24_042353 [Malus domestica]
MFSGGSFTVAFRQTLGVRCSDSDWLQLKSLNQCAFCLYFVLSCMFLAHNYEPVIAFMVLLTMESQKTQHEPSPAAANPAATSCRKKKNEQATFLEDLKDHIDDFVNASMDEHKTCFKKTMNKMFGMSKIVSKRSADTKEVESTLPLQTTVAK